MPRPIPGGVQPFGPGTEVFHVFLPGPGAEPSTITDFHGNVALANVDGTGTGTDTTTGNTTSLLFDVDMRFMQGTFIATDGNTHKGTFTFIWLDLYKEQVVPQNQIHDFNPGIASNGLFWTVHVPNKRAKFDFDDATASLDVKNQDVEDYFNIVNALQDGNSIPATVSYHIHWSGVNKSYSVSDTTNQFQLQVIEDNATISWSASENGFTFVSDPADTSTTVFALIAHERNGAFFPG
jgi:hypothetical protein